MNKNILKKKNAENAAIATGVVAVGLLASGPMKAEADGSSSAGSGGGSNSGLSLIHI